MMVSTTRLGADFMRASSRADILRGAERLRALTLTSHNAKILHADREPEGDSRSDRQARRMGRIAELMVQDSEERRLEELC